MTDFTPGPWFPVEPRFPDHLQQEDRLIATLDRQHIAEVFQKRSPDRDAADGTAVANARLIAAAPDLYAACEAVSAWFDNIEKHQRGLLVDGQTLESAAENWDAATESLPPLDIAPIRAALSKARGE